LLTVFGHKTGTLYSLLVALVEHPDVHRLVSLYGEVTISRGGESETLTLTVARPEQAAPILKESIINEGIVRPYFDVQLEDPLDEFIANTPKHPVFMLGDRCN
jgi:hypothetical protein